MQIIEIVVSVITALGGWEMIKYVMNRRQRAKICRADRFGEKAEFGYFAAQQGKGAVRIRPTTL